MNKSTNILEAHKIFKSFPQGNGLLHILKGIDLIIKEGEAICIQGPSGTGKSTLLHILGTLDRPSSGKLLFHNRDLSHMKDSTLAHFRNEKMGFVFQFHHLLSEFTALENVALPARIRGQSRAHAEKNAEKILLFFSVITWNRFIHGTKIH